MQGRERVMVVVVSKMEGLVSLINNDEQKREGVRDGEVNKQRAKAKFEVMLTGSVDLEGYS